MDFSITHKEVKNFANYSRDFNKIHIDWLTGYNSLYGENIAHGVLVIFHILKKIKFNNFYNIKFNFLSHTSLNQKISIKKINKNYYEIHQNKKICILVELDNFFENIDLNHFKKKIYSNYLKKKKLNFPFVEKNLKWSLSALSKFVGMDVPGKNSLISSIHIIKNKKIINKKNKFQIFYKKIKKTPLFENYLLFKEFQIRFISANRPSFEIKKIPKPSTILINKIKTIKKNIFILGASTGLGYEFLKICRYNKKIKIFASYNNNKINLNGKNIFCLKLNIEKDIKKLLKIIKKYQPLNVYYFASPKIFFMNTNILFKKRYKKFYCEYPEKILKCFTKEGNGFFYPSSILAKKKDSYYSQSKASGEKIIKKFKNNKFVKVKILRLPGLKTKQNMTLIKNRYPFFTNYLKNNSKYFKQILFK
tara:strand:- start:443 stop:1702 length:1260 start_codon:yes stop_codon:yes gene_type:complete